MLMNFASILKPFIVVSFIPGPATPIAWQRSTSCCCRRFNPEVQGSIPSNLRWKETAFRIQHVFCNFTIAHRYHDDKRQYLLHLQRQLQPVRGNPGIQHLQYPFPESGLHFRVAHIKKLFCRVTGRYCTARNLGPEKASNRIGCE